MGTREYFRYARNLGDFSAADCLVIAKMAYELDRTAEKNKPYPKRQEWREKLPDGSTEITLSAGIMVF